jgi:hypothetical protein
MFSCCNFLCGGNFIYKSNNVCLSVCVGSAWKILPVTAHTDRQTDIVQGWPPVLPPLYGQVWSVFSIWTGNGRPTDTVQGWSPVLPPFYGQGTSDQGGGPARARGGGGHGRGRTHGCIMHRVNIIFHNYVNSFFPIHWYSNSHKDFLVVSTFH